MKEAELPDFAHLSNSEAFDNDLSEPYQILAPTGEIVGPLPLDLTSEKLLHWYRTMWLTRLFSAKIVALQRQGRATTWIPSLGQEATAVGIATPLLPQDWLACSPREVGAYFLKGVAPAAIAYFTRGCPPPPALFGRDSHCLPFTIVIGTQTPHAVGLAMAATIRGDKAVAVAAVGDGGSSEGDFNESLNFAGVFKAPAVLVVVNNGWSISVPRYKQSAVKWLAMRGEGFGLPGRLVDGNDLLAMYAVMREATERARAGEGPTLVEAVTYRLEGHSTADDPTRYQTPAEIAYWQARDPIKRFRNFLFKQNILDETNDQNLQREVSEYLAAQIEVAYNYPAPSPAEALFENVYAELTPRLANQRRTAQIQAD